MSTRRVWGRNSSDNLEGCSLDVIWLMCSVLEEVADISIICGHRGEEAQNKAFLDGVSKLRWPHGKHNSYPSQAVDFQPYPKPQRKEKLWASLAYIAGRAIEIGKRRGLIVRWGGDWDSDGDLTDQNFDDLFHLEVSRAENYIPIGRSDFDILNRHGFAPIT
jgi:peptidoglycan LD-endopeptidase CwlK